MTTPNNQPTPPEGYRSPTEDEIEHGAIIPPGTLKSMIDGSWQETKAIGLKFDNIFIYAIPITPTVPATGDTTNEKGGEPCATNAPIQGTDTAKTSNVLSTVSASNAALVVPSHEQRQNKAFLEAAITEQIAHAEHWKEHYTADPNGAEDKAYWNGRHTAFQEALNLIQSTPVKQRQELLPCPFCGGPPTIEERDGNWIIFCASTECAVAVECQSGFTKEDNINRWNTRK